jgi:aconitate hydratase
MLVPPPSDGSAVQLEKGPNIQSLPLFPEMASSIAGPVLIKVGDNISTDTISPAGAKVLPYRSNIPKIAMFTFSQLDPGYPERALEYQRSGSIIVGGANYGQGSSREHAALAPRYLGVLVVIAQSFARIHWQNLVNFGILPLTFVDPVDYDRVASGDRFLLENVREQVQKGSRVEIRNQKGDWTFHTEHRLSGRQIEIVLAGGLINVFRRRHAH